MQPREPDLYKRIYDAAITSDQATLASIIERHKSLDVKGKVGLFTPAARLAAEGNDKAVALLQSFGANPDYIAAGYVYAGNLHAAEKMRREQGVKIHFLALGAGLSGNKVYADYLQKTFHITPEYLVLGAAVKGNDEFAESFFNDYLDDHVYMRARLAQLNGILVSHPERRLLRIAGVYDHALEKMEDNLHVLQSFGATQPAHIFQYHQILQKMGACGSGASHYYFREWHGLNDPALINVKPDTIVTMMDVCGFVYSESLLTYELAFTKNPELIQQLSLAAQRILQDFGQEIPLIQEAFINGCFRNFNQCAQRAIKIIALRQELHLDYDQAHAFVTQPAVRDLLHLALASSSTAAIELMMARIALMPEIVCRDLIRKYLDWSARHILDASLAHFYQQNYSRIDPRYWCNNNLDRSESLRLAAKNANSGQIYGWIMLQFGLFNGTITLASDSTKPKHEQPLSRPNPESGFFKVIKEMVESPRFKILSGN